MVIGKRLPARENGMKWHVVAAGGQLLSQPGLVYVKRTTPRLLAALASAKACLIQAILAALRSRS